jgi:thiol:disulfide interchange protein DsbC
MKKSLIAAAIVALATPALTVHAGEAEVKRGLEAKLGKVEKLSQSPISGLWEAVVDGQVVYSDDSGQFVMIGNLLDLKSGKNLTAERQFAMLPLDIALKQVRGNGKNVLVTFEDPNCGYCKKLAKEIQKLNNVTVYTFIYPVLGEDSFEKSRSIWCANDKMKVWNDFMISGKEIAKAPAKCDMAGLEQSINLGRKLRINGTPAMFFGTGERVGGYIPADEIQKRFSAGS